MRHPREVRRTGSDSPAASLWSYVWRMSEWHQVCICGLAVVVALVNLVPLELQRRIINEVVESQNVPLLVQFGLVYLGVIMLHQVLKFTLRLYQSWLAESARAYTRQHLLGLYGERLVEEEAAEGDTDETGSGRAVSIVNAEVERLGGFVGEELSQAVANVAMLLGIMGYMLVVQPTIALVSLAFLVPQVVVTPFMQRKLNALMEKRVGYLRTLGDEIAEMGATCDGEDMPILGKIFRNRMIFYALKFALKLLLNLMSALCPLAVLIFGGYQVMQGEAQVGVLVAFISGFERLADPLRELISFYRVAAQASVQHDMIAKWMDLPQQD
ncbi:ABC transporter ATP-binding protein [Sulfitobacter sp. D35]|uniref:ABC transporter ATP-binding protein n=1 Tax=Sulfitobacter sp. D35 TaxID=3083252 RepID=UPI00296ED404|nr:ABC transporter ATP-binding protein [Sulfitobacter sp. D35]MDW4499265.1 ABC transporter ATP-binding protein [Sulfitobacter sp. D35]